MTTQISGRFGAINGVGSAFNWNLTETKPPESIINSATKAGTGRIPGIGSWSGSYTRAGGKPAVLPGATFNFKGYVGPTTGVYNTNGPSYAIPAIVSSVAITWDWTSRKLLRHTVNFANTGVMTHVASDPAILDASTPVLDRIALLPTNDFIYGVVPTPITHKKTATLTLTSALQEIANSSSGPVKVSTAGNFDWNLSIDIDNAGIIIASDTYLDTIKLFVNATEFWLLNYGLIGEATNLKVDMESGAVVSQTLNIYMSAFNAAGLIGSATAPGGVTPFWPAT